MSSFSAIEQEFDETLGYIQQDLTSICAADLKTNYTAALLIGCACDIIAKRRNTGVNDFEVFAELLPDITDWQAIAKPLYEAVRHGLAHSFGTKEILFDGDLVSVTISWKEKTHLSINRSSSAKPSIVLNVQNLVEALRAKIDSFRAELNGDPSACDRFRMSCQANSKDKLARSGPKEAEAWRRLLTRG